MQKRILEREAALGADHAERLAADRGAQRRTRKRKLAALRERWEKEAGLVARRSASAARRQLEAPRRAGRDGRGPICAPEARTGSNGRTGRRCKARRR